MRKINPELYNLNISWKKEFIKYKHYLKNRSKRTNFFRKVTTINKLISKINYKDFDIELTPNNSIVYDLLLPNNQMLVIIKSFEKYEDKGENDVIYSIFENKKHIVSSVEDLNYLVNQVNNYIESVK